MPRVPSHRSSLSTFKPSRELTTLEREHDAKRVRGRTLIERNRRLFQANSLCVECAKLGEAEARRLGFTIVVDEWDHIIPLWKGGVDDESNLQGLCLKHHQIKSSIEEQERRAGAVTIA